jgi:hypothetical protein
MVRFSSSSRKVRGTLTQAQSRIAKTVPSLAAVVDPLGDLPGTEKEGALVAPYSPFEARTVRDHAAAAPEGRELLALCNARHFLVGRRSQVGSLYVWTRPANC